MRIISNTLEINIEGNSAVAIGKFDGVHIGHQALLSSILFGKSEGLQAVVFTFEPSPQVFFGFGDGTQLTTREEKRKIFEKMGVDVLIEFPLNLETAAYDPDLFIKDILVEKLHAKRIVAGLDLSFGDKGKGNAQTLEQWKNQYGYEVQLIEKVAINHQIVSSTLIRELVEMGKMEEVSAFLGSPYEVSGTVEKGKQLGRTLDYPTLNLYPAPDKLLPPGGVYCSYVIYQGKQYQGITNVGFRPTVSNNGIISVETFVFDFEKDLYGEEITVQLLKHTRPEMKFSGVEALKEQLKKDQIEGIQYFKSL